ncbi:ABC transporter permease [Nocardioides sp. R-C-SC26]|uniref:ABC transporter permease n=1 Tax=Nocardioides sp. R-C-SC26 TaxID=2870414 RepID=UPI001E443AC5|nr:ABC transporter permease [Nocardioides sp. R-C-SC26]
MSDVWNFLTDGEAWSRQGGLADQLTQQLLLTGTALALTMLVGLPVALWLGHIGRLGWLAIQISAVGRAVPTFALLALLARASWPGSDQFGPYGRAGLATLLALVCFALPPIVTQAYVAMRGVSDEVVDAARGLGMSGWQRFRRIELPLALPLIVSGVRLALVQVWATATIAALVGGPGLGNVIRLGFANTDRRSQGIAGALIVAGVAVCLELAMAWLQRRAEHAASGGRSGAGSDRRSDRGSRPRFGAARTPRRPGESGMSADASTVSP